jgi:poly(ADP-ribose) glycohydrolase
MTTTYRPFSPTELTRVANLLDESARRERKEGGVDIYHFVALRSALTGRLAPVSALRALAEGDPGLPARLKARILPAIIGHARAFFAKGAPALSVHAEGEPARTVIPREEVAGWVAHMVLGTLPHPSDDHPEVDFAPLLTSVWPQELAKLRCVLEYFDQIAEEAPRGRIEVERIVAAPRDASMWGNLTAPLTPLTVLEKGAIEDDAGHRQVDFANMYLGGGVLSGGCVQEEIRFAVAPELLVGMVVSPRMGKGEAILLRGAPRFALTTGYARSLAYGGHFRDPAPRGADGTPEVELVAIDALDFRRFAEAMQYKESALLRELAKAQAGFARDARMLPVATGNWGCGVFGGDPALKGVLQWLAASAEGRAVRYYSFGERRVGDLEGFSNVARARFRAVGPLFQRLREVLGKGRVEGPSLYTAILA